MIEYQDYDALGVAELVRSGEVTAAEVTEAAIARIEAFNPQVNAVVTKTYERARSVAKAPPAGPFTGAPFLLKDILGDVAGVETRYASRFMAGTPAARDHTLVQRYERAGLIILGKTNVPEFGMRPATDSELYGKARNPWDLERTTGGSSGGSAAAVALGLAPMAHGGDAGGSIRMPAAHCGLVGLKPTRGRTPLGPDAGELWAGFLQEHVLTRSVRDSAAALDCTHGPEPGDPYAAPAFHGTFLEQVGRSPGDVRFAMTTRTADGGKPHPECVAAVEGAARLLTELGHVVEEVDPPGWSDFLEPGTVIGAASLAHDIESHAAATGRRPGPEWFEPPNWEMYQAGMQVTGTGYLAALARVHALVRRYAAFMQPYDAWITPTLPAPPGRFDDPPTAGGRFDAIAYVLVGNATGRPSMSLPLHWTAEGLPVGVLFTGRFGGEAMLFRLAAQLEAAAPWAGRRPPTWR